MSNIVSPVVGYALYQGVGDVSPTNWLGWYGTLSAAEQAAAIAGEGQYTILPETQLTVSLSLAGPVVPATWPQITPGGVVYSEGVLAWPGDWSFAAAANYKDTAGGSPTGKADIAVSLESAWGGWLPYAPGEIFDTTPYKELTFAFKASKAGQKAQVYFMQAGDTPEGRAVDLSQYGTFIPGQWVVFTIPLTAFALTNPKIMKFAVQDQSGWASNVFYLDNVGFV